MIYIITFQYAVRENVQSQINGGYTCKVFLSDTIEQVWYKSMLLTIKEENEIHLKTAHVQVHQSIQWCKGIINS